MADGVTLPKIGHNNPPEPTAYEAFQAHLSDLRTEAGNWLDGSSIENQGQADEVSKLMDGLRKAAKDADAARAVEKKPHMDAAKAVDARWKPLIDGANLAVDGCKKALAPWLMKLEAEKRAEAEAARMEAERKAEQARKALAAAAGNDLDAREAAETLVDDAEAADRAAKAAEKDKAHAKGGDRATGLRSYFSPVMTDRKAAITHYWKTYPDAFEPFLLSLARLDVQSGKREIPGFQVKEERRVV